MRNSFIEELILLARINKNIVLIVGDLGYSVVEPFAKEFPDRFINAGVAEQNMAGLAAGMASEGFHVFTYSIANFPTYRCAEQIRNDIDYHKLPVTTVVVGGGLAYGPLGYSHHAIQDYSLMRSLPNMLIASPGDPMEVKACLRYLVANPQPSYLRLGKNGEKKYHKSIPLLKEGIWMLVRKSEKPNQQCFLTTGATLEIALNKVESLNADNIDVYTLPLWGMSSKIIQEKQLLNYQKITTYEDHLIDGGFGTWLIESIKNDLRLREKIEIKALDKDVCGAVGTQSMLNKLGRLN